MKAKIFLSALLVISNVACADSTHVYECIINGAHVFSDHMCAVNAIERNVVVTSRMDPVKVSVTKSVARDSKRMHSSRSSSTKDTRRQRCAKIQKSRDA